MSQCITRDFRLLMRIVSVRLKWERHISVFALHSIRIVNNNRIGSRTVRSLFHFYRPKFGQGNIFTPVCHSVHREGVSGKENSPPGRYPPGPGTSPRPGTPPRDQVPRYTPQTRYIPPPGAANSGIQSTIGRYASYRNAFLSNMKVLKNMRVLNRKFVVTCR